MTGGGELHGDGETSQKLRPDDTAGPEVPDQTVPDDQSERGLSNEIGIDNAQISVFKTTRIGRQIRRKNDGSQKCQNFDSPVSAREYTDHEEMTSHQKKNTVTSALTVRRS
uniref:Uncharacterized protein n=1 Tax=Magallana gigas TaxID=29159 RepID=A0A8W8MIE6_MAGGI